MEIITSHTNADFDALASMVAAKKLYPQAKIVFPGSQEKSMRDFFLESAAYTVETVRLKHVDVQLITRLILVDNRNPRRLGKLQEALERESVSVHIYDHHPPAPGDIRGELEVVEEVGATTTLMTEILRARSLGVTAHEATLFALGIYEETGSLTYTSTTPRDAEAVAWLIREGANLNIVSDFLFQELTAEQLAMLHDLMTSASSYDINGVHVVISAMATPQFHPDLAVLAHRFRDRENLDVLFLVVQMGEKTHMIGRSRLSQVHAGRILEQFGGGGHPTAAAAAVKDMTYLEARERLIEVLKRHIVPMRSAADIMTSPVKSIPSGTSIEQAGDDMTRFGVNVLPVLAGERVEGIITREVVQKALYHGLGKRNVDEFMSTGVPTVPMSAPMGNVERIMLEERQRFIPVIGPSGELAGAITRTDLLRSLHEERFLPPPDTHGAPADRRHRSVRGLLEERLPPPIRDALHTIGDIADRAGFPVFLVGGILRDLFLRVANLDVDIVVEGDGITFAGMLVRDMGGRMKTHQKFGTAVVLLPGGLKIDIATARLEFYDSPAALPTVELSSIKKDLYRRDFTINTLAVAVNRKRFGELIDFFGGLRDIKERNIRVLHNLSFVEDPTRVFRAIRFEQRFHFHISKHTQHLIKSAVAMKLFNRLSGDRIYDELMHMFSETDPIAVLRRMQEFDMLRFLHPALRFGAELEQLFTSIGETLTWYRLLYLKRPLDRPLLFLLGLLDRLKDDAAQETLDRLAVPPRVQKRVREARLHCRDILAEFSRNGRISASAIYARLHPLDIEQVLLMMAKARKETAKRHISFYLTHLREVRITLTGDDLKKLGIMPGPRYKRILASLLDARLDGVIKSDEEEIAAARRIAGL